MADEYIFRGKTVFINKPKDTVIQNFQNVYLNNNDQEKIEINSKIMELVEHVLYSKDLANEPKENLLKELHLVANQVKNNEQKSDKSSLKRKLQSIQEIVSKANDIAKPTISIIDTVLKLLV